MTSYFCIIVVYGNKFRVFLDCDLELCEVAAVYGTAGVYFAIFTVRTVGAWAITRAWSSCERRRYDGWKPLPAGANMGVAMEAMLLNIWFVRRQGPIKA
jgi:hypothetical protein